MRELQIAVTAVVCLIAVVAVVLFEVGIRRHRNMLRRAEKEEDDIERRILGGPPD